MYGKTVIIVDPFSTGALIAPELEKKGFRCYAVKSSNDLPENFTDSYTGIGFSDNALIPNKKLLPY